MPHSVVLMLYVLHKNNVGKQQKSLAWYVGKRDRGGYQLKRLVRDWLLSISLDIYMYIYYLYGWISFTFFCVRIALVY